VRESLWVAWQQNLLDPLKIAFGINANGVKRGLCDFDGDAIFQKPELFQPLSPLEISDRERAE